MKVALVTPSYGTTGAYFGGGRVSSWLLTKELRKRGHEVIVLSFDRGASSLKASAEPDIFHYGKWVIDTARILTLIPYVFLAMRRHDRDVDLFHIYTVVPMAGAGLYKLVGGSRPVVATLNYFAGFCPTGGASCGSARCSFLKRVGCLAKGRNLVSTVLSLPYAAIYPMLIWLMKKLDGYIALSGVVKELYLSAGYPHDKITTIPNFVEQIPETKLNAKGFKKEETFNILYVGRLIPDKGVDILLKAFSQLAPKLPGLSLTIIGGGPEAGRLQELAGALGIKSKVTFVTQIDHEEIWKYYTVAGVFVHPGTWAEPFGRTILEALQFGVPVITSNIGAPPEIVGKAGLIFEKGSTENLAAKLELLYKDGDLRCQLKKECPAALEPFSVDKVMAELLNVYERAISPQ